MNELTIESQHHPVPRAAESHGMPKLWPGSWTMGLKLGQTVPDFELTTFDPVKGDFGKFSLKDQIARKRWSILFFYPADFTFV